MPRPKALFLLPSFRRSRPTAAIYNGGPIKYHGIPVTFTDSSSAHSGATRPRYRRGAFGAFAVSAVNIQSVPRLAHLPRSVGARGSSARRAFFVFWTDRFDEPRMSAAIRMEAGRGWCAGLEPLGT